MSGTARLDGAFAPTQPPFLSIIIPAYNEEKRLPDSLGQVVAYLATQSYTAEIIVVDDGSSDRTLEIIEEFSARCAILRAVPTAHGGKGHACKQGIFASRGQWLFLCDSDLSVPIEEIAKFVQLAHENNPIMIASREVLGARRYGEPFYRHLMGRVFNFMVQILAIRAIQDTQCGFKCFRSDVAHAIFTQQTINGWGFDVEVLFVAQKRHYQIIEVPVNWYYRSQSKVRPFQDAINMFREVWRIRLNDWRGLYKR